MKNSYWEVSKHSCLFSELIPWLLLYLSFSMSIDVDGKGTTVQAVYVLCCGPIFCKGIARRRMFLYPTAINRNEMSLFT